MSNTKYTKANDWKRLLLPFLLTFVPALGIGFKELRANNQAVKDGKKLSDFFSVLSSLGFFLVLEFLAVMIFVLLPQGHDTLLLVSENLSRVGDSATFISSFLFLLLGVFLWSVIAEFGARYAIYVTDNSGKSLSDDRVQWRKSLQKAMAAAFLLLPSLTVMTAILINWFSQDKESDSVSGWCFFVPLFFFYWLFCILTRLYFPNYRRQWFLSSAARDDEEKTWTGKLFGIYNDFVYSLPKPENFEGQYNTQLAAFTAQLTVNQTADSNSPKADTVLIPSVRIPKLFELIDFDDAIGQSNGMYRWIYRIPLTFYKNIHKQILVIAVCSISLFIAIAILPVQSGWYEVIGAPGLLAIAFACWSGIYIGLLYIDRARLRRWKVSIRFLLTILLFGCSYFNYDHPVRQRLNSVTPSRDTLIPHFKNWLTEYKKSFPASYTGPYPVVFICAEGGALRTGAYTALFLTALEDHLFNDNKKDKRDNGGKDSLDFKSSVFAMSGVSGGSLGLSCFNAINYLADPKDLRNPKLTGSAQDFFSYDELSPVIGKMFYGDIINLFLPRMIDCFDRASALEISWENAYGTISKNENIYSESYLQHYAGHNNLPVLLINTTEVETGNQCWLSTAKPMYFLQDSLRDLYHKKLACDVNYSTAVNFSTRFPLFSPGGMLLNPYCQNGLHKLHYLDGGYFENTGSGTMAEVLTELQRDDSIRREIRPIVILLRFSNSSSPSDINFGNELTEIGGGLYNTRSGHSRAAVLTIETLVKHFRTDKDTGTDKYTGIVLDEPLLASQKDVPMNWVLSKVSISHIWKDVNDKLKATDGAAIMSVLTNKNLHFPKVRRALPGGTK